MTTVRDLIRSSLRLLGIYASGETPQASEEADALETLNDMLDGWAAQNLLIFDVKRELYSTTTGTASYTWGPTGVWPTSVSSNVHAVSSIQANNVELPMREYSVGDWQGQVVKSTTSSLPTAFYVEKTWPDKTINLWPIPSTNGQVAIYYRSQVPEFASLDDTVNLPNGYRQALRYNLALHMATEYGKQLDAVLVETARTSLARIKRSNNEFEYMKSDFGVPTTGGSYNNRTGFVL